MRAGERETTALHWRFGGQDPRTGARWETRVFRNPVYNAEQCEGLPSLDTRLTLTSLLFSAIMKCTRPPGPLDCHSCHSPNSPKLRRYSTPPTSSGWRWPGSSLPAGLIARWATRIPSSTTWPAGSGCASPGTERSTSPRRQSRGRPALCAGAGLPGIPARRALIAGTSGSGARFPVLRDW